MSTLSNEQLQERYIAWRSNYNNDEYNDIVFCSSNSVSIYRLRELKTIDVIKQIAEIRSSIKIKCPHCHKDMKIFLFGKG